MTDWFTDHTLRTILLGSSAIGVSTAVLGVFAVLRRQGLVGDLVAHAALPGIVLAYILFATRAPLPLMLGAALTGGLALAITRAWARDTRTDPNTALGVALTSSFGLGVVALAIVQRSPDSGQAGLDRFLFGQVAALTTDLVVATALLGAIAVLAVVAVAPRLKLRAFDQDFATTLAIGGRTLETVQSAFLVAAVVLGLNTVGVVLVSALLVAPAVAARQCVDRFTPMLLVAAAVGLFASVSGTVLSVVIAPLDTAVPTGPVIVIVLAACVVAAALFGPARGIIPRRARKNHNLDRHNPQGVRP